MFNYITGFSLYTLSMIGIIFIAFVVMKKCSLIPARKAKSKDSFLELETSLTIQQNKSIHVIRAGNEKFLVSTDVDRTNFLTKLDADQKTTSNIVEFKDYQDAQTIDEQEQGVFFKGLIEKL